jgi:hypothetical protein
MSNSNINSLQMNMKGMPTLHLPNHNAVFVHGDMNYVYLWSNLLFYMFYAFHFINFI